MIELATVVIIILWITKTNIQIKNFMSKRCPSGKLSSIGCYRRNVLTQKETLYLIIYIQFSSIVTLAVNLLINEFKIQMSNNSVFWLLNAKFIILNDVFFLLLPTIIKIPSQEKVSLETSSFYIRPPVVLEPRRPVTLKSSENGKYCYVVKNYFKIAN